MRRFWFDFVQKDLNYYEPIVLSLALFFLTCCVNSWILGWNEVKYREINCILTKGRTNNRIYLPSKLRLINMKLMSFSYLASCCLESSAFTFKDAAAFNSLAFLDIEILQIVGNLKFLRTSDFSNFYINSFPRTLDFVDFYQSSFRTARISRTFSQVCKVLVSTEFTWPRANFDRSKS